VAASLRIGAVVLALGVACTGCTRSAPEDSGLDLPDPTDGNGSPFTGADGAFVDSGHVDITADAGPAVDTGPDTSSASDAGGTSTDAKPLPIICKPGEQKCAGAMLATCTPTGDGWAKNPCFPGSYCRGGGCGPVENNLLIAFDTSGSMAATVKGVSCTKQVFPNCDPAKSCTRMAVSKLTFATALGSVDEKTTRLALFRFPQQMASTSASTCKQGHYKGFNRLSGDTTHEQHVDAKSGWYWDSLHEVLCVPYPTDKAEALVGKKSIARWMDGKEKIAALGKSCGNASKICVPDPKCGDGACCSKACWSHAEPELRSNGSTPIGKTLFYIGEYFRNRVVIDGKPCIVTADCASPNYQCQQGRCVDPARDCRQNVIVLFTDGGQANDPSNFFAPQVAAKRLRYGLGCKNNKDCAGGAICKVDKCLPAGGTGYHCMATSKPCKPGIKDPKHEHHCPGLGKQAPACLADTIHLTSAQAKLWPDNVLRSPDGKPFSVTVHVVDISGALSLKNSFYLSIAGGGRMLTADIADSSALLSVLESAFDMKNKKVCGSTTQ